MELKNLSLISFLIFLVVLIVVLAIIDPNIATWLVVISSICVGIINKAQSSRLPQLMSWWNNMPDVVHWGLILTMIGIAFYFLSFFIKNYRIKIERIVSA